MALEELHELEPIRGLPEHLPEGEHILWQGSPDWSSLARRAFHVRLVGLYFVGLAVWQLIAEPAVSDGAGGFVVSGWAAFLVPIGLGGAAIAVLSLLAWLIADSTVFTITTRRVVMRFGVALPLNLNLPFSKIGAVAHKALGNGRGDLALHLDSDDRVAYALLWPYARPWFVRKPQPMLRSIPDAERVAEILTQALAASTDGRVAKRAESSGLNPATVSG